MPGVINTVRPAPTLQLQAAVRCLQAHVVVSDDLGYFYHDALYVFLFNLTTGLLSLYRNGKNGKVLF